MKASLQFRLSQHLAMTPQLQQSIRLLQLSTLELNQEIERALAENPLLEREDDLLATSLRVAADGSIRTAPNEPHAAEVDAQAETRPLSDDDGGRVTEVSGSLLDWGSGGGARGGDDDRDGDEGPTSWAATRPTLADHLRAQLGVTQAPPRDRALVGLLIEALDDNGYLTSTLEELHALLSADADDDAGVELDELTAALKLLQSFEPTGVGARNVAECLGIQIDALARAGNSELDPGLAKTAQRIVSEHLLLLAAHDFSKLCRLLGVSSDVLRAAHQLIRGLNPRPGVGFGSVGAEFIVPDVTVRRRGSRWIADLNVELMPRLRVNAGYVAAVRREGRAHGRRVIGPNGAASTDVNGTTWSQRVQEARWLIRNVQQRFDTIARVAQAIVDRQQKFFLHGAIAMRPLVLREIAQVVSLHESTISRVTTGKYMATPHGIFEFKYFFGSHVATESGGAASSIAIRALIKRLIGEENPNEPLSDNQIADLLGKQGIVCARRTVAKYRELLQIPPVAQRRAL